MTKTIAINAGSSSLKGQLYQMPEETVLAKGLIERIGLKDSISTVKFDGRAEKQVLDIENHTQAVKILLDDLIRFDIIKSYDEITGVGHRVVAGGEYFKESSLVDEDALAKIEELSALAPLHNPGAASGIRAFKELLPDITSVAVFDTSFHTTMPKKAYLYSIPMEYYKKFKARKYGAHGTSHRYVSRRAAELLGKPVEELKIITCHLGNGGSVSAIRHGECIDTSMGLTPLEGLVMGTRCGDIDPAIVFYLYKNLGMSMDQIEETLVKKSGLLGLTEVTSDCRYAEDNYDDASKPEAKRALDVYSYRLAKYIGSYMAVIGERLDAIVFTGGIGENSAHVREITLNHLKLFGYQVDAEKNLAARFGNEGVITAANTPKPQFAKAAYFF